VTDGGLILSRPLQKHIQEQFLQRLRVQLSALLGIQQAIEQKVVRLGQPQRGHVGAKDVFVLAAQKEGLHPLSHLQNSPTFLLL